MLIPINPGSSRPIYLQITDHVIGLARSGQLQPNDRLPPSRTLAEQLQVHRSTIVNAYEELKARGVIETRPGSGSYITSNVQQMALASPVVSTALFQKLNEEQLVSQIWQLNQAKGFISLALGLPDDELILIDTFERARQLVLRRDGATALAITEPQGLLALRRAITRDIARHGILVDADDIIVTFGAQEAISLVTRALAARGDSVFVESPTFFGTISSLRHLGVDLIPFDLEVTGPNVSSLHQQTSAMVRRPRFAYVIPDHHNPTGISWRPEARHQFMRWADEQDLLVVEDATYRDLLFEGPAYPPLRALSSEVLYIGSFSKSLIPGLRIGYIVIGGRMRDHLVGLKSISSIGCESLGQRTLAEFLLSGNYTTHIERITAIYRRRRDAVLDALEQFLPQNCTWTVPSGGFYIWLHLPAPIKATNVFQHALQQDLVVAPSPVFYPTPSCVEALRICFARYPEDVLTYAIRKLARVITALA